MTELKAIITSFRRNQRVQRTNQMIVEIEGISKKEDTSKVIGKKVIYVTEKGNEINGKITFAHGNKGRVRVMFEKGMPGQSLGSTVKII